MVRKQKIKKTDEILQEPEEILEENEIEPEEEQEEILPQKKPDGIKEILQMKKEKSQKQKEHLQRMNKARMEK